MNVNQATLVGRLTRDPESRSLPSGQQVTSFSLATGRTYTDKENKKVETTTFHNVVAFGKQAELIAQYVKKGQLLFVQGRIENRSWEKDGQKHYRTEIVVETFQFGPKAQGSSARQDSSDDQSVPEGDDEEVNPEDIPF